MTLINSIILSTPVKCLSKSFRFLPAWLDAMMQCFQVAWKRHSVFYYTKCPTPSPNPLQVLTHIKVLLGFLHSHHLPQSTTTPWHPKPVADVFLCLCFFSFFFSLLWIYGFVVNTVFHLTYEILHLSSFILSKLCLGSWRVQVRFVASESTGRMSPSKQWSWTSPLERGSSGLKTNWTASCRRTTPSPSKPTTVERVPMVPIWRNPTSKSDHCQCRSVCTWSELLSSPEPQQTLFTLTAVIVESHILCGACRISLFSLFLMGTKTKPQVCVTVHVWCYQQFLKETVLHPSADFGNCHRGDPCNYTRSYVNYENIKAHEWKGV